MGQGGQIYELWSSMVGQWVAWASESFNGDEEGKGSDEDEGLTRPPPMAVGGGGENAWWRMGEKRWRRLKL